MSIDAEALARLRSLLAKARATHSAEGAASVEKSHADDDAALLLLDGGIPVGRFDCIHDAEAFATAFNVLREHGDELLDIAEAVARAEVIEISSGGWVVDGFPGGYNGQRVRIVREAPRPTPEGAE